ncbi:MAG: acetyl-CoA carboxylase biotin carboxyl carrier protein [Oscillospiraceae bacterium]|nr:acetyl-CoA carboxylase biotin carboxyl carrier protein [Oscillospiraceae bacterium]
MNLENVKALADVLCAKGLSAIEVGEGENRIRIEREVTAVSMLTQPGQAPANTPAPTVSAATIAPTPVELVSLNTSGNPSVDFNHLIEVKSPLVGVYYSAASPDAENFVSIGSKVKKGDVLCIIETMKLMNEIIAEQDGEIVDICVKNGDIAEFGQVLFKMY